MPRIKRPQATEVTAADTPSAPATELPGELATESDAATTAERPRFRVFAHDNQTGLRYVEDYERRAVALSFPEKPSEETIAKLRESPFKWDTEAQAWLAHANYSNRHAGQKLFREIAGIELEGPTPF